MRAAGDEAGLAEPAPVAGGWSRQEADAVAADVVAPRVELEESDAIAQLAETRQSAPQLGGRHVVDDVGADQQVDRRAGPQLLELAEAGEGDVAPAAITLDHVLARIQPQV